MKTKSKAFTMLELLVVVAILAIIAIVVIPNFLSSVQRSKDARELAEINSIQKAADTYYMDHGSYPTLQGNQPSFGDPKNLKFTTDGNGEGLCPNYLTNLPHFSYWMIDYKGVVYHAQDKIGSKNGNSITLDPKYNYSICNTADGSVVQSNVQESATLTNGQYLKVMDEKGKALPEIALNFEGVQEHPEVSGVEDNPATVVYETGGTKNPAGSIIVNNNQANMYDGNVNTGFDIFSATIGINISGDMTNRVVNILYSSDGGGGISVTNSAGQKLYFYVTNTSNNSTTYANGYGCPSIAKGIIQIILPKDAAKINISNGISYSCYIYEVYTNPDNVIPDTVSNISCTPTEHSIAFKWANPKDADFKQVLIFRDGIYAGNSLTGDFTDTRLYEDKTYNYVLLAQDTTGNVSNAAKVTVNTAKIGIVLRGTDLRTCDGDDNTYLDKYGVLNTEVLVEGTDITNRIIGVCQTGVTVAIKDKDGNSLNFYSCDPSTHIWRYTNSCGASGSKVTIPVIIPENAYKLVLSHGNYASSVQVYEVKEYKDTATPGKVINATYTTTGTSKILKWNNPTDTDFDKVIIFKDGVYIGESTTGTFTDSNSTAGQIYSLIAMDTTGNMSEVVTVN